jgi:hypothetical protein
MPCSALQPTRKIGVAGFVTGGAGGCNNPNCPKACCAAEAGMAGGIRPKPEGRNFYVLSRLLPSAGENGIILLIE